MPHVTTKTEGNVLIVELQRPQAGNALNRALQQELSAAWEEFESRDDLRVAVLHGAGGVFSVGHDVQELATAQGEAASPVPDPGIFTMRLSKPVIAAIEGPCYGLGFELALACDLRVAGEGAGLGVPDRALPVAYRIASVLLPRMTFMGRCEDLLFSGRIVDATEARALRLVNVIAPKGQALASATAAAQDMARRFPDAGAFQKQAIWGLSGLSVPHAMSVVRGAGPGAFS